MFFTSICSLVVAATLVAAYPSHSHKRLHGLKARRYQGTCVEHHVHNVQILRPVLINKYFSQNQSFVINGDVTININNAPTSLIITVTVTSTSTSIETFSTISVVSTTAAVIATSAASTTSSFSAISTATAISTTATATMDAASGGISVSSSVVMSSSSASFTTVAAISTTDAASSTTFVSSNAVMSSSSPSSTLSADSTFISGMLKWHNLYRANNGASSLVWDSNLATYAQMTSDKCVFQHTGGPYGENLAEGSYTNSDYYVYLWYSELTSYNFASPDTTTFSSWGHFSQVVWKATTAVGCGYTTGCPGGNYLVCEYSPPGNYLTQQDLASNVGPAASMSFSIPPLNN